MRFPDEQWAPLSVGAIQQLLQDAPFPWGLAGGYAVEQFLGKSIRAHEDTDIIVFREDQHRLHRWLAGWSLYASDPPGEMRVWRASEWLPVGVHDVWGYEAGAQAWQLQVMIVETESDEWVSRRHPLIRGPRGDLIVAYHEVPCIRIEVQLLYKAKGLREKDVRDFHACLPRLTDEARAWLREALELVHPGHVWLDLLG
jgi:hypothetical protein